MSDESNKNMVQNIYQKKTNVWDFLNKSMDKGVFLIAIFFIFLLAIMIKLPSDTIGKYLILTINVFFKTMAVGWVLWIASIIAWFYHSKHISKAHKKEIDRMANERTIAQEELLDKKMSSTKNKN
jgi:hypothetical protein